MIFFHQIKRDNINFDDNNIDSLGQEHYDDDKCTYDEVKQYINTMHECPPEAVHRLLEYSLHIFFIE